MFARYFGYPAIVIVGIITALIKQNKKDIPFLSKSILAILILIFLFRNCLYVDIFLALKSLMMYNLHHEGFFFLLFIFYRRVEVDENHTAKIVNLVIYQ